MSFKVTENGKSQGLFVNGRRIYKELRETQTSGRTQRKRKSEGR